jgi:hypothetical protein
VPLDNSVSFTYGDELDIGIEEILDDESATIGVLLTAGVKSTGETQEGIRKTGDIQGQGDGTPIVIRGKDKTFKSTSNKVTTNLMAVAGMETETAELKYTGRYIHKGTKEARTCQGYDTFDKGNEREDTNESQERELTNH